MSKGGFFTRIEARHARGRMNRLSGADLPVEYLHKLGPRGVRHMNPAARHPEMPPYGPVGTALVYALAEAPGKQEDKDGRPLCGPSGRRLTRLFPDDVPVVLDNIVRTRPPKNRDPKPVEIECFRPVVAKSIEDAAPKSVIAIGNHALRWFFPEIGGGITLSRGRRFVARVGGHACYVYPVLHPAFVLRAEGSEDRVAGLRGEEWGDAFDRDIRRVFEELDELPDPVAHSAQEKDVLEGVSFPKGPERIVSALRRFARSKTLTIDVETSRLRPYSDGASVLAVAVSDWGRTVAFSLDHPGRPLRGPDRRAVVDALRELLTTGLRISAHNLPFDLEWLRWLCGDSVLSGSRWHCTQVQAFILDERKGGGCQSLDYKCMEIVGISIKALTGGLDMNNLEAAPVDALLRYNAIDAKFTHPVHREQMRRIKARGLRRVYQDRMRVVPPIVSAQAAGLPVNVARVRVLRKKYAKRIARLEADAARRPEVRKYSRRFKVFSLSSNDAVIRIFRDVLERPEGKRGKRYSADQATLESMQRKVPLAKIVLDYRNLSKLKGTYLDKFDPKHEHTLVYPDGRIHCGFNLTFAETGRISSDNPNNQNWPKRRDKHIRRIIVPPPGYVILSFDYGQQEARVLGMASLDRKFVKALWTDYDVHMEWAEKIAAAYPRSMELLKAENMKAYRTIVKSFWVFALFFGAGRQSTSDNLHLPKKIGWRLYDEFWKDFAGVRVWQEKVKKFYARHGYVETLTGRRRHYPLGHNQIINTPIQGTAADLTNDAFARVWRAAVESDRPWHKPVLQIHDDLSFLVPKKKVDEAVESITEIMVHPPFEFVNVPTTVEVEMGDNWYEMKPVGTFRGEPERV